VDDTAIEERLSKRRKTGFCVKPNGMQLRGEDGTFEATLPRFVDEALEYAAPQTRSAILSANRHAPDLRDSIASIVESTGRHDVAPS